MDLASVPEPILTISGLRGIIGDGLDAGYLERFARAFGTLVDGGPVVVARDTRPSGGAVLRAVTAGLIGSGCRVLDLGIAATPTCGLAVRNEQAAGGLEITASHNPIEWNGIKSFSASGRLLNAEEGRALLAILESGQFRGPDHDPLVTDPVSPQNVQDGHLEAVLKIIDAEAIRAAGLTVVLDCNRGAGSSLGRELLDRLGCRTTLLWAEDLVDDFAHPPEPLEEHLGALCRVAAESGADVGFAQDPDADRLAIVDETGRYIGEELTVALCADRVLSDRPGPVVVNRSSSRVTEDITARYPGSSFHRAPVGEANVVTLMDEVEAVLGGEGNGGVIDPRVGCVRDSFVGMALVLDGLATSPRRLSEWVAGFPRYTIIKRKLDCPFDRVEAAVEAVRAAWPEATVTGGDGLRLDWPDRWLQVRGSNTEPVIRVIAESSDGETAEQLGEQCLSLVGKVAGG